MEDHLHEDNKMDHYVRKSFEHYEEDPSPDMWSRIEDTMQPAAPPPAAAATRRFILWRYRFIIATILLLTSALVCEHLYYTARIKTLSEQTHSPVSAPAAGTAGIQHTNAPDAPQAPPLLPASTAASQQATAEESAAEKHVAASSPTHTPRHIAEKEKESRPTRQATLPYPAHSPEAGRSERPGKSVVTGEDSPKNRQSETANTSPGEVNGQAQSGTAAALPGTPAAIAATGGDTSSVFFGKNAPLTLTLLPARPTGLLPHAPSVVSHSWYPVQVHREPSGWYLAAQVTWLHAQEKSRPAATRPNGRLVFLSHQESSRQSAWWGLRAGKKWGSHWSIEAGIGYQSSEHMASHQPRFRFADGLSSAGSGLRDFQYALSTYSGTAEVTLRMETTTPTTPPTPDETVPLKITTTERSEVLQMPLLAAYRLGGRRWQAHLKAGVLAHVTLRQELHLAARVSQSSRFRPVDGQDGYTLQLERAGKLGWGYMLSAGTAYRLNRHWSVVAEPILAGDFARKDGAGQTLPRHTAWGLNTGLQLYF